MTMIPCKNDRPAYDLCIPKGTRRPGKKTHLSRTEEKLKFGVDPGVCCSAAEAMGDPAALIDDPSQPLGNITLYDLIRRSYGVAVFDPQDRYVIENLLFIGDPIPEEAEAFYCVRTENAPEVVINIYENAAEDREDPYLTPSCDAEGNPQYTEPELKVRRIGEVNLQLPPLTPRGAPIRVLLRSDANSLEVTVENVETGDIAVAQVLPDSRIPQGGADMERLTSAFLRLRESGVRSILEPALAQYGRKTGLSVDSVREAAATAGLRVMEDPFAPVRPRFPDTLDRVAADIRLLRETGDPACGEVPARLEDLYDCASHLQNHALSAEEMQQLDVSALRDIFDLASRLYRRRCDMVGMLWGSVSALAEREVFSSEESKAQYDRYLRQYRSPELQKLYSLLRLADNATLHRADFAERCLDQIKGVFLDELTALSIYNHEAGLTDDPYIPLALLKKLENALFAPPERPEPEEEPLPPADPKTGDRRVFGVDLGMTYSSAATLDANGVPVMIWNPMDSSELLASAVYFPEEGDPVVGEVAKVQKDTEPERVAEFMMRYIGKLDAPAYTFGGITYDPAAVSALILKQLMIYAGFCGYEMRDVVMACPAYFTHGECDAVRQAGLIAGLNVLYIINEPVAVVFSYWDNLRARWTKDSRKALVYDLGGSAFDLALVDIAPNSDGMVRVEIIRSDGNDRLGGVDWDERIYKYLCEQYADENGMDPAGFDDELRGIIRAEAEPVKRALSGVEQKSILIKYDGYRTRIRLTREEFEAMTRDLVEQTMDLVSSLLHDAGLTPEDVDDVLLSGGSTYMPMIYGTLEKLFPGKVLLSRPELAVSRGAALAAAVMRPDKWRRYALPLPEAFRKREKAAFPPYPTIPVTETVRSDGKVFGMDLGMTYSAIAALDDQGIPVVIPNQTDCSDLLASAAYFPEEGAPMVGETAKAQMDTEPDRVVAFVKRYIGREDAPVYVFDGIPYDPLTISALILKRMKTYAEEQGYDVHNAVVTCPAYFGSAERAAIRHAAEIAGLNVLSVVNEPTAVVLSYWQYLQPLLKNGSGKVLVYDLGDTLDVALCDVGESAEGKALISIVELDGERMLGGTDWDSRMFDYISEMYCFENGADLSEVTDELRVIIRALTEQTKKDLSVLEKKTVFVRYDGDRTRLGLTREEFEARTGDLVERTMAHVSSLLSRAGLAPEDVDAVLLSGGSTCMPMIQNAAEELFPGKVLVNAPSLAVAKGAALAAGIEYMEYGKARVIVD